MKNKLSKQPKKNRAREAATRMKEGDLRHSNYPFTAAAWIAVVILFLLGATYIRERQKPVTLDIPKFETKDHSQ